MTPAQQEFYYHGLYRVLRRYRTATIAGWAIVFAGVAAIPLGWNAGGGHGLLDLLLAAGTIVAGLVLVSEAVSFLAAYLAVPFPEDVPEGGETPGAASEIRLLMNDIENGGWQEAYAAIAGLRAIGVRHGLPPPGGA